MSDTTTADPLEFSNSLTGAGTGMPTTLEGGAFCHIHLFTAFSYEI